MVQGGSICRALQRRAVTLELAQESKIHPDLYILLCISSLMAVVLVLSPHEESSGHFQLQLVIVLEK